MVEALPSGGPDLDATDAPKTVSSTSSSKRPGLLIRNVAGDSYKGAGRVEKHDQRQAAYRAAQDKAAQEAEKQRSVLKKNTKGRTMVAKGKKSTLSKQSGKPVQAKQGKVKPTQVKR